MIRFNIIPPNKSFCPNGVTAKPPPRTRMPLKTIAEDYNSRREYEVVGLSSLL